MHRPGVEVEHATFRSQVRRASHYSKIVLDRGPGPPRERGDLGSEPPVSSDSVYRQITLAYVLNFSCATLARLRMRTRDTHDRCRTALHCVHFIFRSVNLASKLPKCTKACPKVVCGWGSVPDSLGELTMLRTPL